MFRRIAWLVHFIWIGLLLAAVLFNRYQLKDEVLALAKQSAELSFTHIKNISRWNLSSEGIYTPVVTSGPDQVVTKDGMRLQRMVTSQILGHIQSSSITTGVRSRIIGLDPINSDNLPDEWEKTQLEASTDTVELIEAQTTLEGEPYYRVIHPLQSRPECLTCHEVTRENQNFSMGAFSVLVPLQPIKETLYRKELWFSVNMLILWFFGFFGIEITTRTILKRIKLRDKAREDLTRANNVYDALVATTHAIINQLPQQKLFEKVCEVAVQYGGFKLAWVGIVNKESKLVESVARSGSMGRYVQEITVSVDSDSEYGGGPTSIAIRENRPVIVKNFIQELSGTPWYEPAMRAGIRSSAAFPIVFQNTVIGAFKLYADKTDYFSERLIELLKQMSFDISFALDNLDKQQQFLEAQKLNQTLIDALPYPALLARFSDQRVVIANRKALEMGVVVGEVNSCCALPEKNTSDDLQVKERQRKDGQWDMICWCPVDDDNQGDLYLHFAVDITKRKKQENEINDIANRDHLTGLSNRRYFNEKLERRLRADAEKKTDIFSLLLIDLNGFKLVNDTHGHLVGDQLLIKIGQRLQGVLREGDTLCRWGGDEFVIMLPGSDHDQAQYLSVRLQNTFSQPFKLGQLDIESSCSIGAVTYPQDGTNAEQLLKAVDQQMYAAKRVFYQ